jgi:SAM-dependent methyltransferase
MERTVAAWRAQHRVEKYARLRGWIDTGERIVLNASAARTRGRPVLDLGVGAGRTTGFLRLLTDEYVGIDRSAEMVAACRAAYPGADVRVGDARDLTAFPDASFALVVFSYNGIDNLDREGRLQVLDEVLRVLELGGLFVYCTLSKLGSMYRRRPSLRTQRRDGERLDRFAARSLFHLVTDAPQYRPRMAAWKRAMLDSEDHGGWGLGPVESLEYALNHFTTAAEERRQLSDRGFEVESITSASGRSDDHNEPASAWFYVVARKPGVSS